MKKEELDAIVNSANKLDGAVVHFVKIVNLQNEIETMNHLKDGLDAVFEAIVQLNDLIIKSTKEGCE